MSKLSKFFKEKKGLAEFLRYLIIGFSTTFLNWAINILLSEYTVLGDPGIGSTIAVIIAWTLSTIFFAFWMYKFFVFRSKSMEAKLLWREFAGFTGARLFTLGVETVITFVCCSVLDFDHIIHFGFTRIVEDATVGSFGFNIKERYIVKLFSCVITTILNYIFSKVLIFKKGQRLSEEKEAEADEGQE